VSQPIEGLGILLVRFLEPAGSSRTEPLRCVLLISSLNRFCLELRSSIRNLIMLLVTPSRKTFLQPSVVTYKLYVLSARFFLSCAVSQVLVNISTVLSFLRVLLMFT